MNLKRTEFMESFETRWRLQNILPGGATVDSKGAQCCGMLSVRFGAVRAYRWTRPLGHSSAASKHSVLLLLLLPLPASGDHAGQKHSAPNVRCCGGTAVVLLVAATLQPCMPVVGSSWGILRARGGKRQRIGGSPRGKFLGMTRRAEPPAAASQRPLGCDQQT